MSHPRNELTASRSSSSTDKLCCHLPIHNRLQQILGAARGGGASNAGASPSGAGGDASNPFAGLGALGGFGGLGGAGGAASGQPSDSRPPEERYASQLQQLRDMGFVDGQANLRALLISGGSVEGAISILLG